MIHIDMSATQKAILTAAVVSADRARKLCEEPQDESGKKLETAATLLNVAMVALDIVSRSITSRQFNLPPMTPEEEEEMIKNSPVAQRAMERLRQSR